MIFELFISVIIISFIFQFFDSYAGMGYGTLTPILLLLGFPVIEVVSAVILASSILSLLAGFLHHGFQNIDLRTKKNKQILLILISFGIVAVIIGAFTAINIPEKILKIYIGLLIIIIGASLFIFKKKRKFSKKRLMFFGSLASFNKGISGGGYGPVLAGGQISSGVKSKQAVGITAFSEGVVSLIGFLIYLFINGMNHTNWGLVVSLLIGGIISTPLAVLGVKKTKSKKLKYYIAAASIMLGIATIFEVFF